MNPSLSRGMLVRVNAWPERVHAMRKLRGAGALAVVCITAACSGSPSAGAAGGSTPAASPGRAGRQAAATGSTAVTPDPVRPQVTLSRMRTADGSVVTLAVFKGPVRYVLHNGSRDPGHAAKGLVTAGPAVKGTERGQLLAAFNGGFMLRSRAGGYAQEGHVIRALRHGFASLVIDRSGQARIGVWGNGLPAPGEAVYSVRQNLWPLVFNGQPTGEAARWQRWGGTISHKEYVARSAVGQDAAGDLIFAASMSASPADLAEALARSGARIGMELDINPEWVQLDVAHSPGGPLTAAIPGQVRSASQYLAGWTRDFFTVLAPAGA